MDWTDKILLRDKFFSPVKIDWILNLYHNRSVSYFTLSTNIGGSIMISTIGVGTRTLKLEREKLRYHEYEFYKHYFVQCLNELRNKIKDQISLTSPDSPYELYSKLVEDNINSMFNTDLVPRINEHES